MTDQRSRAASILQEAHRVVTTERGQQHGDAADSFRMIAEMWRAYLNGVHVRLVGFPLPEDFRITNLDVAQMMATMKQARVVFGDTNNVDNFVDPAGYSALAGMFAGAGVPASVGQAAPAAASEHTDGDNMGDFQ